MKTAFLTGTTGQDGSLLSKLLLDKGYKVIGMMRRTSSPTTWRLKELGILDNPNFFAVSGDLTDQSSIDKIIVEYQPDEIYNLGAQSFVGASWSLAESTLNTTGLGAVRIFEVARKFVPQAKIYQASSSEMFGGANRQEIFHEQSHFEPRSPYGVAKILAHNMAKVYRESYNMFISCGILFNHESEYRGIEFVTRKISVGVAKIYLRLANSISLGSLSSARDFGYAPEYVEAMWLMLQQEKPDDFVIATNTAYTIHELLISAFNTIYISQEEVMQYIKTDPKFIRPADVGHLRGDYKKALEKLGWQPQKITPDIMRTMVKKDIERLENGAPIN